MEKTFYDFNINFLIWQIINIAFWIFVIYLLYKVYKKKKVQKINSLFFKISLHTAYL